jgi:hypothetical protein
MSRTTTLLIALASFILAATSASADPLTVAEVAGVYKIDPSLVRVGQMPTNFLPFAIVLKADGTFMATNVPAHLIFESKTAVAHTEGTWKLRYESYTNASIYKGQNYIDLDFATAPGPGSTGLIMDVWGAIPIVDKGRPCIKMSCQFPNTDWLVFYLSRQK